MRRRALGKGLEALIPSQQKGDLAEGYRLVPIGDIKPNPHQPRAKIEDAEIQELIASIREKGVIEPLIVKRTGKTYVLAAGERRLRAARRAGLKEVPVIIRDLSERELLEIGLIENLHRKDLNPIEEATAYDELNQKYELTHDQIAQLVGKERSTVTNTVRLLSLPEKVKKHIRSGKLDQGHARALLSLDDDMKIIQIAERIVKQGLTVRATENLVKRLRKKPRILPQKDKGANLIILEDELSKLLHTKVTLDWKKNRGTVTIHCYSLEDFDRIYSILKKSRK
ncbi:MAG: ParB/RepB/Spo0J family partition protein [candidate division WOR-3 bacterium]|nr:MAG: ParB/RepB/Spo0J family partition protein [candidate division WOR-3 bacterium]